MKGGVTLFRGSGVAAGRYLESDRSTADDYYFEGGIALAEFTLTDAAGDAVPEAVVVAGGVRRIGGLDRPADRHLDGHATSAGRRSQGFAEVR